MKLNMAFNPLRFTILTIVLTLITYGSLLAQQPPGESHRSFLLTAMKAKLAAKSFRVKEVISGNGPGVALVMTIKGAYIAPDRYHGVIESDLLGEKGTGEALIFGDATYVKNSGGKWQKKQADTGRVKLELAKLRHEGLVENLSKAKDTDVSFSGREVVDGIATLVYQFSFNVQQEVLLTYRNKVWVRTEDGFPHKIELETLNTHKGLRIGFKTTTTYYDYNADIKIDTPE